MRSHTTELFQSRSNHHPRNVNRSTRFQIALLIGKGKVDSLANSFPLNYAMELISSGF